MKKTEINRRDFNRLTSAAFGGMVAGAMIGCNQAQETANKGPEGGGDGDKGSGKTDGHDDDHGHDGEHGDHAAESGPDLLVEGEKNVCRGLNHKCANHKGGTNACAGQGACATADAHTCHEANACKGQGGCGENPGQNACKGKGECAVPLGDKAWAKARATFEEEMDEHDKKYGPAPAKPTS